MYFNEDLVFKNVDCNFSPCQALGCYSRANVGDAWHCSVDCVGDWTSSWYLICHFAAVKVLCRGKKVHVGVTRTPGDQKKPP